MGRQGNTAIHTVGRTIPQAMNETNRDTDDSTCIARIKEGDGVFFGILYERYIDRIYAFIFYRIHNKETAEDLTSQTFMKVFEKIHTFDAGKASFPTWVYRIARNTLIDHYRTHKQEEDIFSFHDLGKKDPIEKNADMRRRIEEVEEYMQKLTKDQREIVIMRVWDELSFKEIAAITGKSEASCKVMFSRTIRKIRSEFPAALVLLFIAANVIE